MSEIPILAADSVSCEFTRRKGLRKQVVRAVDGVTMEVFEGETVGVVGESGSGKSTLSRMLLRLQPPASGKLLFRGEDYSRLTRPQRLDFFRDVQVVFQDPGSSLNPRKSVRTLLTEVLLLRNQHSRQEAAERVPQLLEDVELDPEFANRMPSQLSGGQKQRVAIARAIAMSPSLIVADEALSALDVSVQAGVLRLMKKLQKEHNLAYLFISHDLGVVREICERVLVMHRGRVVEQGRTAEVLDHPQDSYTQGLLKSRLIADPSAAKLAREELRHRMGVS